MQASTYLMRLHLAVLDDDNHPFASEHNLLTELLGADYEDPHQYFMSRLFIGLVASFEVFLQDLISLVCERHPQKLGSAQFRLTEILEAETHGVLIQRAVAEFTNKLMYKKPNEYLAEVANLLSIDVSRLENPWKIFTEAKARRDLGVHANWQCNEIYMRKLKEVGVESRFEIGDSTVPDTGEYLQQVIDSLGSIVDTLTNHLLEVIFKLPDRVA